MREYCAATVAITAAALDILGAWDRPDRTSGLVRSLATATATATAATGSAIDISRHQTRPDQTEGPVRSLATATAARLNIVLYAWLLDISRTRQYTAGPDLDPLWSRPKT